MHTLVGHSHALHGPSHISATVHMACLHGAPNKLKIELLWATAVELTAIMREYKGVSYKY